MWHRGALRKDINEKCVFCKTEDNRIGHVTNNCIKFKKAREEIINKPNIFDTNTKNKTILEIIEYFYYSKRLSEAKDGKKNDNKGIQLIKEFIKNTHYIYGKELNKKEN